MSGVECAGLVLAVLPLVIEAAKSYINGVDTIRNVLSKSRRDDELEDFYHELWMEMFLLDRQLRDVVEALPFLTEERKASMLNGENLSQWTTDSDVAEALQKHFNSEADYHAFTVIMGKIVQLLAQLIRDSTTHVNQKEMDPSGMYRRLKAFEDERRTHTTSSNAKERFRFWKKEKDRKKCLQALRTWNKNLLCHREVAHREPVHRPAEPQTRTEPPPQLREVSRLLYKALARYWSCNCTSPHQARFCLTPRQSTTPAHSPYDFLFSTTSPSGQTHVSWMEGTVLLQSKEEASKYECAALNRICDALRKGMTSHCLNFLVTDAGDEPTLWQLRPQPRHSKFLESASAVSLQSLLHNSHHLPLIAKRKLAVILARSLLHLHEGLWLGTEWSKRHITFFYANSDTIDYQRPYVTTSFDGDDEAAPDLSLFHRNASILALGILLVEIHTGKPIETYRTPEDLCNGTEVNANTDWTVADRVVKSLDDCSHGYKDAVSACLDTSWVPAAQRVNLDDELTRKGFYSDVVQPLEDEVHYLFRERF
ncbi:MAG: hypothetical protein L6R41_001242 [Letrouitia leprolyta]|nr:MAG: hypothetical protein L6R41_001242 [Letrouitia leprolyta]